MRHTGYIGNCTISIYIFQGQGIQVQLLSMKPGAGLYCPEFGTPPVLPPTGRRLWWGALLGLS